MSTIEIRSGSPITEETITKIEKILSESICPNESLRKSIPEFVSFDELRGIIQLADGNEYRETIFTFGNL